ncbi:phenylalanine--tRNA ligase subunit beta [Desulfonatronospira sp.]|uniref:phenylalanine--tRNA ligase subunit beta n=1 Tax=Desulfonatronospira sp. TaxID=1962951 RepID=UPI0025C2867E|nr:phenylalanine--tRNA ligase subunit beta [Desulfonatronospira sp.]
MLLSLSWLREFTPYKGSIDELAHRLTMVGLEVEEIVRPFAHLAPMVVGRVVEKKQHPGADKLSLCRVDAGTGENLSIVCGAPNVNTGQNVAVALEGTELPGGQVIKKTRIRGETSQGMICSEAELELGQDSSQIMVLDDALVPGTGLCTALDLEEFVLDIGVTPNRPDCLSVMGLAREVAALFDLPLHKPDLNLQEDRTRRCQDEVQIVIDDPAGCPLYQARIISGCSIKPSPGWMRYRLMSVGVRPINNIVDITNYIMLEQGQPLHAFDRDLLQGDTIRVDRSRPGLMFTTLDEQERELNDRDLLIWDREKPVALAGVMGGANTEINDHSTEVVLECAVFNPLNIRQTARRLGLHSESSFRFERGVDQVNSPFALDRAAQLMSELGLGRVFQGVSREDPRPCKPVRISFRRERANSLLALDVDQEYCGRVLTSLGCEVGEEGGAMQVTVPSYRPDITREVDLIEEIGRIYGLDKTPEHLPKVQKSLHEKTLDNEYRFLEDIKQWARGLGLQEVINYSFVGMAELDLLEVPLEGRVKVFNPLSEEQDVMRTHLLPGLLNTLKHNLGQGNTRLKLFEAARSFEQDSSSETGGRENNRLALLLYGRRYRGHWPHPEDDADFYDLKGLVENLLGSFGGFEGRFVLHKKHPYLDPAVECLCLEKSLGMLGRVAPDKARSYKARKDIWYCDLDLDLLQSLGSLSRPQFQQLPRFPVVKRDMTIVSPLELGYEQLHQVLQDAGVDILEDISLVDVYLPPEKQEKKLTLRLTYRHQERTLKDSEVDKEQQKLADLLLKKLPVGFA